MEKCAEDEQLAVFPTISSTTYVIVMPTYNRIFSVLLSHVSN
jgi:hypothetical protein